MSSHHIVKDGQEPALIIANGAPCSMELLEQCLEWSPLVVVLDRAVEQVVKLGVKVDAVLGDFDGDFDPETFLEHQHPVDVIHLPDQESTDLEKAIQWLIERGYEAVNILWATGKRADHTLMNLTSIVQFKEQIKIVVYDDYSKVFPLASKFEKWYPAGTKLSIMPVGKVGGYSSEGLKYNLTDVELNLGYRTSSSNEITQDGWVRITHQSGDLLMMECHD